MNSAVPAQQNYPKNFKRCPKHTVLVRLVPFFSERFLNLLCQLVTRVLPIVSPVQQHCHFTSAHSAVSDIILTHFFKTGNHFRNDNDNIAIILKLGSLLRLSVLGAACDQRPSLNKQSSVDGWHSVLMRVHKTSALPQYYKNEYSFYPRQNLTRCWCY